MGVSLMLSQFVRLWHVEITSITEKPIFGDEFEMCLVGVAIICASTRESGRAVRTLCFLFLVGMNERAVKLHSLRGWEISPTFWTAMPVILKLISERRNLAFSIKTSILMLAN
jgi:hypothetical protein